MSDSIGPSSLLPGQRKHWVPDGTECERCSSKAEFCVVGETDSFGSEVLYLCSGHYAELIADHQRQQETLQHCDICGHQKTGVKSFRDPAEGSSGPIYMACDNCRAKVVKDFIGDDEDDDPWPDD